MRPKEQQSFSFSHVLFPAPEVLEWGPCLCRQENSRDGVPVPGSCAEKEGLAVPVGHSHAGGTVSGVLGSQVPACGSPRCSAARGEGAQSPGAGVGEGGCFALRRH